MGRAFEVRKKAMAATAAVKTKVYAKYGKEIYLAAKAGVPDPEMNTSLKHVIERAKKAQVPTDVIKRAIDKAKAGGGEDYIPKTYEGFGPGASTIIVECLTDNDNRAISDVRACFTKNHCKLGVTGCVSHSYDHVALIVLKGMSEDEVLEACMNDNVDISNVEAEDGEISITADPGLLNAMKDAIVKAKPDVEILDEEVTYLPSDGQYVSLEGEDKEYFERLIQMLEEVDDVQDVYHNVG